MNKAKYEREEAINPIKTMAITDLMNPINITHLSYVSKGGRLVKFAKDFAKMGYLMQQQMAWLVGGGDNYKLRDSFIGRVFGGLIGVA